MIYLLLGRYFNQQGFRYISVYGDFPTYYAAATQFIAEDLPYYDADSYYYLVPLEHMPIVGVEQ